MIIGMDSPFDDKKEEAQLAQVRSREEEDVARILSEKYGIAYTDLSLTEIDTEALRLIPEEEARAAEAAAFAKAAKALSIAVHNPNNPALIKLAADLAARGFTVKEFLVSKRSLDKALSRYTDLSFATESKAGSFTVPAEMLAKLSAGSGTLKGLRAELDAASAEKPLDRVSRTLEAVLAGAFALHASDIHLEAEEGKTRLRLRIDGLLTDAYTFDAALAHQLNSRIKLLAGIKLNVTDRAQDGRFSVVKGANEIEMRVSFIPGNYGEAIVMRILDPSSHARLV